MEEGTERGEHQKETASSGHDRTAASMNLASVVAQDQASLHPSTERDVSRASPLAQALLAADSF